MRDKQDIQTRHKHKRGIRQKQTRQRLKQDRQTKLNMKTQINGTQKNKQTHTDKQIRKAQTTLTKVINQ